MKTNIKSLAAVAAVVCLAGGLFASAPTRAAGGKLDPLVSYRYAISDLGYASDMSAVGSDTEVIEHKIVSDKGQEMVQKIPGRLKFPNVALRRGLNTDQSWVRWRKQVEDGQVQTARKDLTITVLDETGKVVATFRLLRAWPMALSESGGGATEELTIAYEGWVRQ